MGSESAGISRLNPVLEAQQHASSTGGRGQGKQRPFAIFSTSRKARAGLHVPVGLGRGDWTRGRAAAKWARQDSNLRPTGYEPAALTPELRAPDVILIQVRPSANGLPGFPIDPPRRCASREARHPLTPARPGRRPARDAWVRIDLPCRFAWLREDKEPSLARLAPRLAPPPDSAAILTALAVRHTTTKPSRGRAAPAVSRLAV